MTIIEQSIIGKRGTEKCEDAIVTTPAFMAVIDGSTSKSSLPPLRNGKSGGRMAADIVREVIDGMPPETTVEEFVSLANTLFQRRYAEVYDEETIQNMLWQKQDRWTCSVIVYSLHENSIWMIGDCMGLLVADDGSVTELTNDKPYEAVLAARRAAFLHKQLAEGKITVSEQQQHDTGRDIIIPSMLQEMKNQNVTYAVLDGFDVAWRGIRVIRDIRCREIVLASDGYPKLFPTLQETESYLRACLTDDPLMISRHPATKAWMADTDSFDDRTFLRFEHIEGV